MPQLPRFLITIDGGEQGTFFWDARLSQLRKTDNPHAFDDVEPEVAGMLELMRPGDVTRLGGGAEPVFEYRRLKDPEICPMCGDVDCSEPGCRAQANFER